MDKFLDKIWDILYTYILLTANTLNALISNMHFLGPGLIIFFIALTTVAITKFLKKNCTTKRHSILRKDFEYWLSIREEAMQCSDREEGKRLAKNIDQAKLNKAYYDYFFEGFLLSMVTTYLPIIIIITYVNKFYNRDSLSLHFGKEYVFQIGNPNASPTDVGAVFWYIVALLSIHIGLFIYKKTKSYIKNNKQQRSKKSYAACQNS